MWCGIRTASNVFPSPNQRVTSWSGGVHASQRRYHPNLEEQKLGVVLVDGRDALIKYQIAHVSRALHSGHRDSGKHVVFGRRGCMTVNLRRGRRRISRWRRTSIAWTCWVNLVQGLVGKIKERAGVWRNPVSPSADDAYDPQSIGIAERAVQTV